MGVLPLVITLVVAPAQLKMEADTPAATATVTVSAPGARTLRLWCSAGALSSPALLDDGRFVAQYRPPATGRPTWALLAAWDEESGEAATATVALAARTEIPVETEAGAQLVVSIHGRRATARANASGQARVTAWVWPGEGTATVTAIDAVGNSAVNEVALALPRPDRLFILAPARAVAGVAVPVYVFAVGGLTPRLSASGGTLSSVVARSGSTSALLRVRGETTLTATAGDERVQERVRVAAATPPPERSIALVPSLPRWAQVAPPVAAAPASPSAVVAAADRAAAPSLSPWELGASGGARYGGSVAGVGAALELRRRLGRFAAGCDLDGHWVSGRFAADPVTLGGLAARVVGEARFDVARRVTLVVAANAGGHWARLRRRPAGAASVSADDGGPSLGGAGGLLVRLGPGMIGLAVGYAWTPLVRNRLINLDGAVVSVGYRVARWRRRGGRTRRAGRRRRGRDR